MTLRGIFFIGLFGVCSLWALANPFAGIVAYVVHYHSYPERSWWGAGLSALGIRYSYTITACLTVGTLWNLGRLPYGRLITRQEVIYLTFLGWLFLLGSITGMKSATFHGGATGVVDSVDKMLKLAVFVLALTHVVVTPRRIRQFTWLLIWCAVYLGYEAYTAPAGAYFQGRLEGVGGPDFGDANALAAHMVALLPIIGVRFLDSPWQGKALSFVAGGLAVNTVVATRSRGAFLAVALGFLLALLLAPKGGRKKLWPLLLVGVLGSLTLVDSGFMARMGTLESGKREDDESAQSRLRFWRAGLKMVQDHPLGVGPSNFPAYIGNYLPDDAGRDTHQTFIRCAAELGLPGFALFLGLIVNALLSMARLRSSIAALPAAEGLLWFAFALQISLSMYLFCGLFGSFIYSEMLWWLLLLPSSLERAVANLRRELCTQTIGGGPSQP